MPGGLFGGIGDGPTLKDLLIAVLGSAMIIGGWLLVWLLFNIKW